MQPVDGIIRELELPDLQEEQRGQCLLSQLAGSAWPQGAVASHWLVREADRFSRLQGPWSPFSRPLHVCLSSSVGQGGRPSSSRFRRVVATALFTLLFATVAAKLLMAPRHQHTAIAVSIFATVLFCEALQHAAGRPAMQALTCLVILTCALAAAATWRWVGVCTIMGCLPAVAAGGCIQSCCIGIHLMPTLSHALVVMRAEAASNAVVGPLQLAVSPWPVLCPATEKAAFPAGSPKQLLLLFLAL